MTYQESSDLMRNSDFRGRIQVACLKYSKYILNEEPSTPAHYTRYKWAQATTMSPEGAAAQIQSSVVMEDQVQTDGDKITDANLQVAVETVVNKVM